MQRLVNLFVISAVLFAHEGHAHVSFREGFEKVIHWIGNFHLIFLHFPIALIIATALADLLFLCTKKPWFFEASRFMIFLTAISAVPTVLTGFAFAYKVDYEGILLTFFWLHLSLGLLITLLAIAATILRELHVKKKIATLNAYYVCLIILFVSVNATGFFGGEMTFGPNYFSH